MNEHNGYYNDKNPHTIIEKKLKSFFHLPDEMMLESGAKLGPITIAYETLGQLSPNRDNVVLVCHALSGSSHVAGYYSPTDQKPGWWDNMVGSGKGIDKRPGTSFHRPWTSLKG